MGEYDAYHSGISGGCIPAGGHVGGAPAWRAPAWRAHAPLFAGLEGTPAWDARARPLLSERAGARRRPVLGGGAVVPRCGRDGAVAAREIDQGEGGAAHGAGGGGAASVWRPRPTRGESNQRIRFLWAKGIWVILCPALVLKMDD